SRTAERSRPLDYDPRTRPWYVEAVRRKAAVLTEPYRFAQTNLPGVSAGVPLGQGGVIGFDFTLDTLSRPVGDYKLTPNAIIMIASEKGTVFMESEACKLADMQCLPGEDEVRAAMKTAIAQFGSGGRRIEHDLSIGAREYRLLVHDLPPVLG